MSSITANASKSTRSAPGTRLPSSVRIPTANAISVAIGIAQPAEPARPTLRLAKITAGTSMPPSAAASGSAALRKVASSPSKISRRISRPTTRKNTVIAPSLIQKCSECSACHGPMRPPIGVCHRPS
jgi:hypothetical protein